MRRGADAAPSRSRNVGLTTLVLAGLCMLGLATSQAVAQGLPQQTPTEPTTTTVATAPAPPPPAPDPRPAPKPDQAGQAEAGCPSQGTAATAAC